MRLQRPKTSWMPDRRNVYVACVDPSFRHFGWSIVELRTHKDVICAGDVIVTKKADKKVKAFAGDDNHRCTQIIAGQFHAVLSHWKPKLIISEAQSGSKSSRAAQLMGMAWATLSTLALIHQLPVLQATPQAIKKANVGKITASKEEVQSTVRHRYAEAEGLAEDITPNSLREHFYDSISAFVACLDSNEIRTLRLLAD